MKLKLLFLAATIVGCASTEDVVKNRESEKAIKGCEDVPGLSWEYYERGMSADEILQLASKLVVAGEADAKLTEDAQGSVDAEASIKSLLAKEIKTSIKQSSSVSDEFWEQEIAFQQTLCLLRTMQTDSTLQQTGKDQITQKILDFTSARIKYVLERKKKYLDTP